MLLGGKGLFATSDSVSRSEFRTYVERLDLPHRYSGIQGIGYVEYISPGRLPSVIRAARLDVPNFDIRPQGERAEYTAILYLEPLDRRNRAALGFDMFTESVRREAMERARNTGLPSMSGKVTLAQEIDEAKQAGFLLYAPLYRSRSTPVSLEQRRSELSGYVYSPFRADDLLWELLRSEEAASNLDLQVYDEKPSLENLLHISNQNTRDLMSSGARFRKSSTVSIAGRLWTLTFASTPDFERDSQRLEAVWISLGGVAIGFVLFGVLLSQTRAHERAER